MRLRGINKASLMLAPPALVGALPQVADLLELIGDLADTVMLLERRVLLLENPAGAPLTDDERQTLARSLAHSVEEIRS